MVIKELWDYLQQYESAKNCYEFLLMNLPDNKLDDTYVHNLECAKVWMEQCGGYEINAQPSSMLCQNCMEVACEC